MGVQIDTLLAHCKCVRINLNLFKLNMLDHIKINFLLKLILTELYTFIINK